MSYASNALTAKRLLTRYGQALTITHYDTSDTYDSATGVAESIPSTQSGYGAIFDYKNSEMDGTLIEKGDKKLLLSAVDITAPQLTDIVTIAGIDYTIVSINTLSPGGVVVMYTCQLRGA